MNKTFTLIIVLLINIWFNFWVTFCFIKTLDDIRNHCLYFQFQWNNDLKWIYKISEHFIDFHENCIQFKLIFKKIFVFVLKSFKKLFQIREEFKIIFDHKFSSNILSKNYSTKRSLTSMPSVSTITLAFLSVLFLSTNSQDFCQSFRRNGFRVIIVEEYNRLFTSFMIIDKHFWKVKYNIESQRLDPLDKKAANPRKQFVGPHEGGNYSFAFIARVSLPEFVLQYYVFHKVFENQIFFENE